MVLPSLAIILVLITGFSFLSLVLAEGESKIPAWIRTAVGFWVNNEISDDEFLKAIEYFVENEIIEVNQKTADDNALLIDNLKLLQTELNQKIEQSRELSVLPQIQDALMDSNTFFAKTGNPESIMLQIDDQWQSSDPNEPDSVAYELIHNPSGDIIRAIMEFDRVSDSNFKYAEIFITNQYGANVAQSHKTSDYRQDDEQWWQNAKQNGIFLSEGGYDESAGVYASDIAISISDEEGNFIGVLKAVVNIESVTRELSR